MTIKTHIAIAATISLALIALIACQQKTEASKEQSKAVSEQKTKVEEVMKNFEQEAKAETEKLETKVEKAAKEFKEQVNEVEKEVTNQETKADSSQEKNLILNPDFKDGFDNWRVNNKDNVEISLVNNNDGNIVKFSGDGSWSTLSQKINVEEGKSYKFVVEIRCEDWSEDSAINFTFKDVDKNINYMSFKGIETGDWTESSKTIKCIKSGEATALIQYKNKGEKGAAYIRQIKAIEL